MLLKNSLLSLLFLTPGLLFPQYQVFKSSEKLEKPITKGFYYTLPQREIEIEITYIKTSYNEGIYSNFAEKLLGIKPYRKDTPPQFQISSCQLKYNSLPDPSQVFYVSHNKGSLSAQLSSLGCLLSVNDAYAPTSNQIENSTITYKNKNYPSKNFHNQFVNLNLHEKLDTVYQNVQLDTITIVKKIVKSNQVEKTSLQKAEEMAKSLISCRENRVALLAGMQEVNYDPHTLKFMCDELQKMETEYFNNFVGTSETQEFKITYKFIPTQDSTTLDLPIFVFSSKTGITPNPQIEDQNLIRVKIENANSKKTLNFETENTFTSAPNGFYYRIPAWVNIYITYNEKILQQETIQLPQWGTTVSLPATPSSIIRLDEETGGLIYFEKK